MARAAFFKLLNVMGYGSAKQYAGRRTFVMYSNLCVPRADEESAFWREGTCLWLLMLQLLSLLVC